MDHTIQQLEARFSSEDLHTYSLESVLVSTELPDDTEAVLGSYPEVNVAYIRSELPIFHRHAKSRLGSVAQVVAYASSLQKEIRELFPSGMALIHLLLTCCASRLLPKLNVRLAVWDVWKLGYEAQCYRKGWTRSQCVTFTTISGIVWTWTRSCVILQLVRRFVRTFSGIDFTALTLLQNACSRTPVYNNWW